MESIEIAAVLIGGAVLLAAVSRFVKRIRYNRREGLQLSFRTERQIELPTEVKD